MAGQRPGRAGPDADHRSPGLVLIVFDLDFIKPFESPDNRTEFTLLPKGGATEVTWAMSGRNDFMGKLFGVFMNMDAMIGKDFEAGLAGLKAIAEKSAARL